MDGIRFGAAALAAAILVVPAAPSPAASAAGGGEAVRTAFLPGGRDGMNVDLIVRRVTVAPVRAFVGETVRVEALVENRDEGTDTTDAVVYANGKPVAHRLFTWGLSPGERLHRLEFEWNTAGAPPGEYSIRVEAFAWNDASPFDNRMDVKEPVRLVPPGGSFPGGAKAGGSAGETDPRFGKDRLGR